MKYVLITALGIAACSFGGALIGFLFKSIPPRLEDALTACAAGIMLCAAVLGLVVPSAEFSGENALWLPSVGILCGALFLTALNRALPATAERLGMTNGGADEKFTFEQSLELLHKLFEE